MTHRLKWGAGSNGSSKSAEVDARMAEPIPLPAHPSSTRGPDLSALRDQLTEFCGDGQALQRIILLQTVCLRYFRYAKVNPL